MNITSTLSLYLAKRFVINLAVLLFGLLCVIYLFDTVELIRRASKHADVPISLVLKMGVYKLPEVGQTLFPFGVLFGAMFTFWQLTRRYELIVIRASGFSVWQFLLPLSMVGILFGALQMGVINPVGAIFISKYEKLERTYLKRQDSQIAVFQEGLWLKQAILIASETEESPDQTSTKNKDQQNTTNLVGGYVIVHAPRVHQEKWALQNATILYFTDGDDFLQRIDAQEAILQKGQWILKDLTIHKNQGAAEHVETYTLPTTLTARDIEESFASPESMSFWKLPAYIKTLEGTGFDATRLKVYYHSLLAQPLMFCAMILLAASVSMRPPRSRGTFLMIAIGVFIGFLIFFLSSFLQALGISQQIPIALSAWSPAMISFLLGLSVMMTFEDG